MAARTRRSQRPHGELLAADNVLSTLHTPRCTLGLSLLHDLFLVLPLDFTGVVESYAIYRHTFQTVTALSKNRSFLTKNAAIFTTGLLYYSNDKLAGNFYQRISIGELRYLCNRFGVIQEFTTILFPRASFECFLTLILFIMYLQYIIYPFGLKHSPINTNIDSKIAWTSSLANVSNNYLPETSFGDVFS